MSNYIGDESTFFGIWGRSFNIWRKLIIQEGLPFSLCNNFPIFPAVNLEKIFNQWKQTNCNWRAFVSKNMILKSHFQLLTENCLNCVDTLMSFFFFFWLFTLKIFRCFPLFLSTKCHPDLTRVRNCKFSYLKWKLSAECRKKVHLLSILSAKLWANLFSTNKYTKFRDRYIIII